MIEIKFQDGKFLVKGTFHLGLAGIYENKEYGIGNIQILLEQKDVLEEMDGDHSYSWGTAFEVLKNVPRNGEAIAAFMTAYYNKREQEINIKQFNDNLWFKIFDGITSTGCPLCDIDGAILPAYQEKIDNDKLQDIYKGTWDTMSKLEAYDGLPNDGSVEKPDIEGELREMLPFFNFDGLEKTITPEYLTLSGGFISFQCSDQWKHQLLCSAYDELDEKNAFTDWHNF